MLIKITARISLLGIVMFTGVACNFSLPGKSECKLRAIKTIFFDGTPDTIYGETYVHYVLLKDFSRDCLDSVTIINIASKYCDTVKAGKPVKVIKFFRSEKDFIPYDTSQVMTEIDKSCLVTIGIDLKTKRPDSFVFYNKEGQWIYSGNRWKPRGVTGKPLYK